MRQRFCRVCKGWHDPEAWPHNCYPAREYATSDFPAPYCVSDTMEPTEHPCDGVHYSSKSQFRRVTKDNNCVEVGNDPARLRKYQPPKPSRQEIRDTIKAAKQKVLGV